jgi:hypothetical protein
MYSTTFKDQLHVSSIQYELVTERITTLFYSLNIRMHYIDCNNFQRKKYKRLINTNVFVRSILVCMNARCCLYFRITNDIHNIIWSAEQKAQESRENEGDHKSCICNMNLLANKRDMNSVQIKREETQTYTTHGDIEQNRWQKYDLVEINSLQLSRMCNLWIILSFILRSTIKCENNPDVRDIFYSMFNIVYWLKNIDAFFKLMIITAIVYANVRRIFFSFHARTIKCESVISFSHWIHFKMKHRRCLRRYQSA